MEGLEDTTELDYFEIIEGLRLWNRQLQKSRFARDEGVGFEITPSRWWEEVYRLQTAHNIDFGVCQVEVRWQPSRRS